VSLNKATVRGGVVNVPESAEHWLLLYELTAKTENILSPIHKCTADTKDATMESIVGTLSHKIDK